MYRVSPRLLRSLKFARLVTRVEWSYRGSPWTPVPIDSGSVTCDRNATARWQADLVIPSPYRVDIREGINPYGCLFRIYRGIRPTRGSEELVPWGVYRVEEASEDKLSGGLSLTLFSREKQIEDARFLKPRQYKNIPMIEIVRSLVTEAVPGVSIAWDDRLRNYQNLFQSFIEDKDRWGVLEGGVNGRSLAGSMGAEMFFDGNGTFRVHQTPRLTDRVVWEVDEERFNFLLSATGTFTRDGVYNVIATRSVNSDGAAPVPSQFAWDNEPSSPTYAGPDPVNRPDLSTETVAPFGIKPRYYSSPFFRTEWQAKNAAEAIKAESLGLQESFSFSCFVNPALEAGDVIRAMNRRYIVDSWKADLLSHKMDGTTRSTKNAVEDFEVQSL